MLRIFICLVAAVLIAGTPGATSAQSSPPAGMSAPASTAKPASKPSRMKLTAAKLRDMKAKWSANRGKLKACRKEVKSKGLMDDDRWFYIEECMDKT
jgi:hypothetical protein